jgi:hypothetical protein
MAGFVFIIIAMVIILMTLYQLVITHKCRVSNPTVSILYLMIFFSELCNLLVNTVEIIKTVYAEIMFYILN